MTDNPLETSVDELAALCARQFDAIQRTMVTREDLALFDQEIDALRVTTAEELHALRREVEHAISEHRAEARHTHELVRDLAARVEALVTVLGHGFERRLGQVESDVAELNERV